MKSPTSVGERNPTRSSSPSEQYVLFGTLSKKQRKPPSNFSFTDLSTYNVTGRSVTKTLGNMLPFTLALAASVRKGDFRKLKDVYKLFGKNRSGLKYGNIGLNVPKIKVGGKTLLEGGRKTIGGINMNTIRMGQTAYMGTIRDNYNENFI